MEIKYFFVMLFVQLTQFVFADDKLECTTLKKGFEVCQKAGKLISVQKLSSIPANWLTISDNKINSIDENTFNNLSITHLTLDLSNSKLELETESFNGLPSLRDLQFDSGVVTLKDNLFQAVKNILTLSIIIDGQSQTFENGFLELGDLIRLTIHDSNLGKINSKTFLNIQPKIRQVILQRNNITSIEQTTFHNFENLKTLTFISNNIDSLRSGIFDSLKELEVLEINDENITSISKNIFNNMEKLQELNLNSNKIKNIQTNAFSGSKITRLGLAHNAFDLLLLPGWFNGLDELKYLSLRGNNIRYICVGAFNELNKLTRLDLSHNQIFTIHPTIFSETNFALKLDLSYNKFAIIDPRSFQGIQINTLDLTHNDFDKIEDGSFNNSVVKNLYIPDLEGAQIDEELKTKWGLNASSYVIEFRREN